MNISSFHLSKKGFQTTALVLMTLLGAMGLSRASVDYSGSNTPAASGGPGYIGFNGTGSLSINTNTTPNTSTTLTSSTGIYVGVEPGDIGTVTVTGAGAQWNLSSTSYNGLYGTGTINVDSGGVATVSGTFYNGYQGNGTINIDGGSLTMSSGEFFNGRTGTGAINISNGGTMTANVFNDWAYTTGTGVPSTTVSSLNLSSGGTFSTTSSITAATTTIIIQDSGSKLTAVDLNVGTNTPTGSSTLTIENGGAMQLTGLLLSDGTTSASNVTVDGGTLTISDSSGLNLGGEGSSLQIINGGTMSGGGMVDATSAAFTTTVLISGQGSLWSIGGSGGTVTLGSIGNATLTVADGGEISATKEIALANLATGTITGTLQVGNGGAPGIVDTPLVQGPQGGNGTAKVVFDHDSTDYYFTSDGTSTGTGVVIAGTGTQVVVNAGTTTLTATSTYSGTTTINGGTLLVDGKQGTGTGGVVIGGTGYGSVVVGAAGTLGGSGTIVTSGTSNTVSISGTLSPGDTASGGARGTLSFNLAGNSHLTFNAGSKLVLNLFGGGVSDQVAFTAAPVHGEWLAGGANLTLVLNMSGVDPYAQTYVIFSNAIATATTGLFTPASITGYDSTHYTAQVSQVGNDYDLSFAPVTTAPEPSTWLLLAMGFLGLVWRVRGKLRRDIL